MGTWMSPDHLDDGPESRAELRVELLRIVRTQADRAQTRRGHDSLDELRKRCYSMLIRAAADGVIPRNAGHQASGATDAIGPVAASAGKACGGALQR